MIDTHCHLTDERLATQVEAVIVRARDVGVTKLISIGTSLDDSLSTVEACRGRDAVRCAVGVHPNYCQNEVLERINLLRGLSADPSVVALGEMGLDYHHEFADRTLQAKFFQAQLQIAGDLNKPVVIHCREATNDTLAILSGFPRVRAVFHCFTGTVDEARRILDAGYLLGFTGPITYKNNDDLRSAVRLCPTDRMLVETDAPYLSPEPVRKQKTCEPAFVMYTAQKVAEIKQVTLQDVDQFTTDNAQELFGWGA